MRPYNNRPQTEARPRLWVAALCILAFLASGVPAAHGAAQITVVNLDGAGEGFNDPSPPDPDSTAGGNTGATLGQQRLIAFQAAADIWAAALNSDVEIRVDARFDNLTCSSTSAILGSAGPLTVHRDFTGAPRGGTWYVQALANSLAGVDLSASNDIGATFNSAIGTTCAFPRVWYYGLDGNPPGANLDFLTVVLHELAHGLGFLTLMDLDTGAKFIGRDDAFMVFLENHATGLTFPEMTDAERLAASTATGDLQWIGPSVVSAGVGLTAGRHPSGHVEMYAPASISPGSSVSHFSTSLAPDELMEPSYTAPTQDLALTKALFSDLGWWVAPEFAVPAAGRVALALAIIGLIGIVRRRMSNHSTS